MNIDFHSEPDNRERMLIQLSEFSFAAYPVQINQGFRCVSPALPSQTTPDQPQWRGWIQQISNWLGRVCSQPTTLR